MSDEGETEKLEISKIGVIVKDVDKTVEYYSKHFGWGPWRIREINRPDVIVHGKKTSYKGKVASINIPVASSMTIELIQYVEGTNIFIEHLKAKGEGIHHLRFRVKDLEKEVTKFKKQGFKILQKVTDAKNGTAYIGTDKVGGIVFQLSGPSPSLESKTPKSSRSPTKTAT